MKMIHTVYTLSKAVRDWSLPETTVCKESGLSITRMPAGATIRVGTASIPLWGMLERLPDGTMSVRDGAPEGFMRAIVGTAGESIVNEFLSSVTAERREELIAEIAEAAILSQWRFSA